MRRDESGFTLIELMVVVLIMGILIAIALPIYAGARQRASDRAVQEDMRTALAASLTYFAASGTFTGLNDVTAEQAEPGLTWVTATQPAIGDMDIQVATGLQLLLVAKSRTRRSSASRRRRRRTVAARRTSPRSTPWPSAPEDGEAGVMYGTGFIGFFARRLRAARDGEQGITLVELMVAVAVFSVIMGGALMGFSGAFRLTRDDRSRSVAANLASQEMDTVRALAISNFDGIHVGTVLTTRTVDGVPYSIKRRDRWMRRSLNGGPCDGASNFRATELSVKVTVTWPNMGDTASVTSQTVLTPPRRL